MGDYDAFSEMERSREEEYFRKREQELLEKLRLRLAVTDDLQRLSSASGVADEEILSDLRDLGYDHETIKLLHLVPLIQVAWSDGVVTAKEIELIREVARSRGVEKGSPVDERLTMWLTVRPPVDFFRGTLRLIGHMLGTLTPEEKEAAKQDIVKYCTLVAQSSGGILGIGRVSAEEQMVMDIIAAELEANHPGASKRVIEDEHI